MNFPFPGRRLAALWLVLGLLVAPAYSARKPGGTGYTGAITLEAESGQVIFEDNADEINPPASMTKLMTFAVLHDKLADGSLQLTTPVTVTAADSKIGGTQVWLKQGEVFPVEELIYAMMIQSANDAAYALARTAAGSPEAFVGLMNAKARAWGMTRTTFRTPHGLPPSSRHKNEGDLTSPRDFANLCRHLILETDVLKYTSIKTRPFGSNRPTGPVVMNNHNHLLGKVAGLDGLKTGFTGGAGFCLSATAQRNGRRIIVVAMGGSDSKSRDFRIAELVEEGFSNLPARLVRTGPPAAAVAGGAAPAGEPDPASARPAAPGPQPQAAMFSLSAKPAAAPASAPAPADDPLPTVKTAPGAGAAEQNSTPAEPVFTFRVIPPK